MDRTHPCLTCGACCACFRVSFYWGEADDGTPGGVPAELTDHFSGLFRVMKGTSERPPRCVALAGEIGKSVCCTVWSRRPSVCCEFPPSFENGTPHDRCDQAREIHGLPPLTPADWIGVDRDPGPVTEPQ